MMYHEPAAAPTRTSIKIGTNIAAVFVPLADCGVPKNLSQFGPLKSGKQSQIKSPVSFSIQ
jgi:hypothetical protein